MNIWMTSFEFMWYFIPMMSGRMYHWEWIKWSTGRHSHSRISRHTTHSAKTSHTSHASHSTKHATESTRASHSHSLAQLRERIGHSRGMKGKWLVGIGPRRSVICEQLSSFLSLLLLLCSFLGLFFLKIKHWNCFGTTDNRVFLREFQ